MVESMSTKTPNPACGAMSVSRSQCIFRSLLLAQEIYVQEGIYDQAGKLVFHVKEFNAKTKRREGRNGGNLYTALARQF